MARHSPVAFCPDKKKPHRHLSQQLQDMNVQPSTERVLKHREIVKAWQGAAMPERGERSA
jgi:hypothetical protein